MPQSHERACRNLDQSIFNPDFSAKQVWEALLESGAFVEGNFVLASGKAATLKVEADRLYSNGKQLDVVLGHFARFPCINDADALVYVPEGMREFTHMLGEILNKPVISTLKTPGSSKRYDFSFKTNSDEKIALEVDKMTICEDIVTTLGSVAGVRTLLSDDASVHSLATLLRGTVSPDYQAGLTDHYILSRHIPTDKDDFRR